MAYELYYWPGIQGRGEFVRLALEEAAADYVDIVRQPGKKGMASMMKILDGASGPRIPFAPPFLKDGDLIIGHVANILMYLGPKLGLAPNDEALRFVANGLQLSITDIVAEVHDTHHPIAMDLYYEDQVDAAKARSASFIKHRMPKYLSYFERVLKQNPKGEAHAVGGSLTYVDLSLFQLIEGLHYAFPRAMKTFGRKYPALANLRRAVAERPRIVRYLASERRIPFNESGIFRHYPELDQGARSR
ncbi:MAG TPA: glutathione S-transferase [Roseiarcus sp.]|nr:glutathione S-transferase [Roseiarcus sp.]